MTPPLQVLAAMREDALAIFHEALDAVNPIQCIKKACTLENNRLQINNQRIDLNRFSKCLVIGAGKASAAMADAMENILGDRIDTGIIVTKTGHGLNLEKINIIEASHPVPDEAGVLGTQKMMDLARSADEHTLVICLISGGGSALTPMPVKGVSLADKQQTTTALLNCGAAIHEINTIRKHLSGIKGGRLANAVFPGTMVCLVLSDVVGNDLSVISSGPAVPDATTFRECLEIIQTHNIESHLPASVCKHLAKGAGGLVPETPKPGSPIFDRVRHYILADNMTALSAAKSMAIRLGYNSLILSSMIEGETRYVAKVHTRIAREIIQSGNPLKPPACIISGGETTVTIRGNGKGGRNQEFAVACAEDMGGLDHTVILSCGTDGTDGPTDAAGGLVDTTTSARARDLGFDVKTALLDNNAYPLLEKTGDLVITGPTKTNVMDLRLALVR